ncbi:MAG TPA: alpha/beta fold hydrolase [Kofleriaceae bacterium]|nr:alpha/beta fold hydrolase [Kofleriaceae bacterium]
MPTLERDGASIYYDVQGAGPPLILGHSLLFDGRMWEGLVPRLAKDFRVLNVDARGHRHSTTPGRFTLEDLADDWLAILDQEKIEKALLCGLSMGGMTAMRLALRAPHRVAAMALLDTSADPEPVAQRRAYRVLAEIQRAIRLDPLVTPVVKLKMFGETTRRTRPETVAKGLAIFQDQDPKALYPALRAVFDRPSIARHLSSIATPTLVLCGQEDVATPPDRSQKIATSIPGATLHMIPEAGHLSALEQPATVADHLEPFLARHGPPPN